MNSQSDNRSMSDDDNVNSISSVPKGTKFDYIEEEDDNSQLLKRK